MTQAQHVSPAAFPHPSHPHQSHSQTSDVFGTLFFEVVLSGNAAPALPGWSLRLWPQARLGDATLEASPVDQAGTQSLSTLASGLKAQGVGILGPVRHHR